MTATMESEMENLGRYGHHPDPLIDFCVEVECIESLELDVRLGFEKRTQVIERCQRAMEFRGVSPEFQNAKAILRKLDMHLRLAVVTEQ